MAYTPANPQLAGAVSVFDAESPAIFTGRVISNVSGGQFVVCSGITPTNMGSLVSGYESSDLNICPATVDACNGIALYNQTSGTNNYVAVARKGVFLVSAGGPCSGGTSVFHSSGGVASASAVGSVNIIGRSFNAINEGQFGLVALNC